LPSAPIHCRVRALPRDIVDGDGFTLLKFDPATQVSVWIKHEADGRTIIRHDQPLGDIFTANHEANVATNGQKFGDWVRVASVPTHMTHGDALGGLGQAVRERDKKHIARVLNDPDNQKLRTSRGRV
jgi:hypothetical protein